MHPDPIEVVMIVPLTDDEVRALPAAVPLVTAGRAFGMGRTKSYELARAGEFPCSVLPLGPKFIVPKTELLAALGIEHPDTQPATPEGAGVQGADLGNLDRQLRLQCRPCGWVPPGGMPMEGIQLHFQAAHGTSGIILDLIPACRCGESMTRTGQAGETADSFRCGACGSTGYATRKQDAAA